MIKTIYVQLLGEGTRVYRPVPAREIGNSVYEVMGFEDYDNEDESWEFTPGTYVIVEKQKLNNENVLVAVKKHSHYFN